MKLTDFHSNGAVCSPTRAALLTGRYQQRCGITGVVTAKSHRHTGLDPKEVTFAEVLKQAGYVTGMFGKWHTGYATKFNPVKQGFDEFRGYVSGNVDFHSHIDQEGHFDWWRGDKREDDKGYTTDLITKYGVDFIKRHKDKPFLLYLPHEAPHYPLQGRNDPPQRSIKDGKLDGKLIHSNMPKGKDDVFRRYKEMIEVMDESVGAILAEIKTQGLTNDTFVFFFSDNGPAPFGSAGPLRGRKGSIFEGGHRVSAAAYWPGKITAGSTSDQAMMGADLFATMVELAGAKLPAGLKLDGVNLLPALVEQKPLASRSLFWGIGGRRAIRKGDWKLIVAPTKKKSTAKKAKAKSRDRAVGVQLFNLKTDIGEKNNLAAKNSELVKKLRTELDAWYAETTKGVKKRSG